MSNNEQYVCRNLETQEIVQLGDEVKSVKSGQLAIIEELIFPTMSHPRGFIIAKSAIADLKNFRAMYLPIAFNCEFELVN